MRQPARRLILLLLAGLAATPVSAAEAGKQHRVVFQVDTADPATMNLTLNNATNVVDYYRAKNEEVEIDIVAFGPGLAMYRADKSTVADRIAHFADYGFPSKIQFSACNNTKTAMEKAEGHPISLLPQATIVPSGVVQIMERQEQGWSYVRP
ncbi:MULTISPECIES: hypothetical protein [Methylobacterium]|uniref:DsrE family protein n=1 Tax=Methylobacterium TaxID=407 RepID=UPI0006AFA1C6|nr:MULTISPECIES: hypothetical protein [Methylobacterium]KOX53024.1 hypothetical protein ADL19_16215 [Streptomyces purpurogeneiscleroticus]MDH2309198.1 hypothetical protein [Methylobacterium brachiatum]RUP21271.1 MAG: hypothetical protein EKK44_10330 [Methylobacterium sp.]